jgi:hypothetical protein
MSVRVKILTNLIFPMDAINPQALIGKQIEILQLNRTDQFTVDQIEYDAEYPDRVEVAIYPTAATKQGPLSLRGKP